MDKSQALSGNQSKALGNFISFTISKSMCKWDDSLWDYFDEYELVTDENLSPSIYYSSLKSLPVEVKRDIIKCFLNAWNCNNHYYTLYDTITSLIYLKICDVTEFHLLNILLLIKKKFDSNNTGWFEAYTTYHFDLCLEDGAQIGFSLNDPDTPPFFEVIMSGETLKKAYPFEDVPTKQALQQLFEDLKSYPSDRHCRRVVHNCEITANYIPFLEGTFSIRFNNLEYIDYNG